MRIYPGAQISLKRSLEYTHIPQDALKMICKVYGFHQELVRNKYLLFQEILKNLNVKILTKWPKKIHNNSKEKEYSDLYINKDEEIVEVNNLSSLVNIFQIMNTINIKLEFQNFHDVIKFSLTLTASRCTLKKVFPN